jgi:hypothetical protein
MLKSIRLAEREIVIIELERVQEVRRFIDRSLTRDALG